MENIIRRLSIYSVFVLFGYLSIFGYSLAIDSQSEIKNPAPIGIDFAVYYTAGSMVLNGQVGDIYDYGVFHTELEETLGREIPQLLGWIYPPLFLLLIVPFALLPYSTALILWILITLSLAILVGRAILPTNKSLALLMCGFPGVLMNLRWGQNGFLNTALIGLGIHLIDSTPLLSGFMFGLLTYKPQMAFFPLLLLFLTRKWKVLIWAASFSILNIIASAALFHTSTWINYLNAFFQSLSMQLVTMWVEISAVQPSIYSFLNLLGVENNIIKTVLLVIGIITTVICVWVWQNTDRFTLKGTVIVLGILITMPYYMQYDLMILSLPLILMTYDFFLYGSKPYEIACLVLLWLMPLMNWPIVMYTGIQICPIILIMVLIMTVLRVDKQTSVNRQVVIA